MHTSGNQTLFHTYGLVETLPKKHLDFRESEELPNLGPIEGIKILSVRS